MSRSNRSRTMAALTAVCAVPMLVAACSGGSSGGASGGSTGGAPAAVDKSKEFSVLLTTENSQTPAMFKSLAAGACKAENDALPLKIDQTPSANMQQKIQLLAGQNALPVMFAAGTSLIAPGGDLDKAGQVLNIKDALTQLGVYDQVTPSAAGVVDKLYSGGFPTVPLQSNIEGIFYNKKILADHGIPVPTTVAELTAAADKLKAAGVTPFTASGKTGWTISRWIGALLFRSLGPNAMSDIKAGKAKLTDPQYVAAAQQLQDMGKAGYFSNGVTNIDYDTEFSQMLNGQAAMMYMGSWFLAQVNDPKLNKVGDAIAFAKFPGVDGGKGTIEETPANVGSPNAMSKPLFGPKVGAWLTCIVKNYGSASLKEQGSFSGLKVNTPVPNLPPLTTQVQDVITGTKTSVLWFEALFNQKATTDASNNAAPLLTGNMSAQDYMAKLQADLDSK